MDKVSDNNVYAVYKITNDLEMQQTRQCLICDALENPKAHVVNTLNAWLCPECKRRLKQMMYMVINIKPKTYCEKWPIGCQTCDLTLCDGKKDMHDHFRDDTKMAGLSEEGE